jgi:uroporphyrinogen-III synthase
MSDSLPEERQVEVDEIVVYGTRVMSSFEDNFTRWLEETEETSVRWVVVFSPTGCEAMLRSLGILGRDIRWFKGWKPGRKTFVASIGPTTRDYLDDEFGFDVDVCAETPSPEGVLNGIEKLMKSK